MSETVRFEHKGQIERVESLITAAEIQTRVKELGAQISNEYRGQDVMAIGILKGAIPFYADLIRAIDLPLLTCDFLGLSSYGSRTESSGVVRLTSDLTKPVAGKHLLIVEDIVDTGLTMTYLLENLKTRKPASVQICTLLDKPANRKVEVHVQYTGFTIANQFVVGYGLDYDERYRQLSHIGVLHFDDKVETA